MISIIIPVKDEPYVYELAKDIGDVCSGIDYEILVLSGQNYKYDSPFFKHITVYGDSLERAILTGFSVAKYDNLVVMDGDGQHPPGVLKDIYHELSNGADVVIASRFLDTSYINMSGFRKLVSRGFNWFARFVGAKTSDPMSGYFGVKRGIIENTEFNPFKWKVLTEILVKNQGCGVKEVPYEFQDRVGGVSSTSYILGMRIMWDLISTSSRVKHLAQLWFALIVFGLMFSFLNLNAFINSLSSINLNWLGLSILSYVFMSLLMGVRLKYVFQRIGENIKFRDVFMAHSFGMLSSNIGFGKVGYLSTVPIIKRRTDIDSSKSLGVILGIESIDLLLKGLTASVALYLLIRFIPINANLYTLILTGIVFTLAIGVLGVILLFYKPTMLEDFPVFGKILGFFRAYPQAKSTFLLIIVINVVCWLLRGLEWYFIGKSLGIEINYMIYLSLYPLFTITKFIPLTPSGIGIFEFAMMWGMSSFGMTLEHGMIFGLLDRFDNILDFIAIKELIPWRKNKVDDV